MLVLFRTARFAFSSSSFSVAVLAEPAASTWSERLAFSGI
jgi:hypothetical protein